MAFLSPASTELLSSLTKGARVFFVVLLLPDKALKATLPRVELTGKGGKNRRRGKNENDEKRELVFKEDGQGACHVGFGWVFSYRIYSVLRESMCRVGQNRRTFANLTPFSPV